MRTVFILGITIMLSLIIPRMAPAETVGKIIKIEGRVDITSPNQKARTANIGDELFQGDFVRTKSRSKAEILFADGTTMRLAQSTRIEVSEYVVTPAKRSSIIKLFRGTVQSKVKKMFGRLFGSRSRNRYEIHTPTAVCGVRGTDYFSTYQGGASHFLFKEGSGYGYSINKPDEVGLVNAGQIMSIAGANQSPLVRPASDTDLQRFDQSTNLGDGQEDSGKSGEEGGNDTGIDEGGDDPEGEEARSDNPIPLDNTLSQTDEQPIPLDGPDDPAYSLPDYQPQDDPYLMPLEPIDTFEIDPLDPTAQDLLEPDPFPDVYIPPETDEFEFVEPFTIDSILIAGTHDGYGDYPMSLNGTYAWQTPFIHMGEGVRGTIELGSGALSGAFYTGFIGANFHDECLGNTIEGGSMFLYRAQDSSGGILMDNYLSGDYFPSTGTWSAGATLRPIEMVGSGSLSTTDMQKYDLVLKYEQGGFYTTSGEITVAWSHGHLGRFVGQDWGLWRTEAGGDFTGTTATDWHIDLWDMNNSFPNSVFRYMQINGSEFLYGNLEGDVAGGWVNLNQVTTGVLSGSMHGGFDPNNPANEWFAVSGGTWIETNRFLQMTQTPAGQNKLNDLNIPHAQVGQTNLSTGANGVFEVNMNNVTFFAYTTGGSPRIWATNNVSGYASITPTIGHTANLTGSGLNVDFKIQKWDNGVWGSELEGGGVYNSPAQSMHNKNILMKGGATGQFHTDGSFSGTAAGTATTTY